MRWFIGLLTAFILVILVNSAMIYLAVTADDPIVPSYTAAAR